MVIYPGTCAKQHPQGTVLGKGQCGVNVGPAGALLTVVYFCCGSALASGCPTQAQALPFHVPF